MVRHYVVRVVSLEFVGGNRDGILVLPEPHVFIDVYSPYHILVMHMHNAHFFAGFFPVHDVWYFRIVCHFSVDKAHVECAVARVRYSERGGVFRISPRDMDTYIVCVLRVLGIVGGVRGVGDCESVDIFAHILVMDATLEYTAQTFLGTGRRFGEHHGRNVPDDRVGEGPAICPAIFD